MGGGLWMVVRGWWWVGGGWVVGRWCLVVGEWLQDKDVRSLQFIKSSCKDILAYAREKYC